MNQKTVIQQMIDKTMAELNEPVKPVQRSRVWKTPEGYKFLVQWSNLALLRLLVKKVIDDLSPYSKQQSSFNHPLRSLSAQAGSKFPLNSIPPLNPRLFSRLEAQLMDAIRSCLANLEEGWKRPTTSEYLQFLGYSQASLEEVKGDVKRMAQDGLLVPIKNSSIEALGIDLKAWNIWARDPVNSSTILYFPLKNKGIYRNLKDIKGRDITYEILIELVNKTDYLMRTLVVSLESKLGNDQKYYQVEKARIRGNSRGWK